MNAEKMDERRLGRQSPASWNQLVDHDQVFYFYLHHFKYLIDQKRQHFVHSDVDLMKKVDIHSSKPYIRVTKEQSKKAKSYFLNLLKTRFKSKYSSNVMFMIIDESNKQLQEALKDEFILITADMLSTDNEINIGLVSLPNCAGVVSSGYLTHVAWALDKVKR